MERSRGHDVFTIATCSSLEPLLGCQWYVCVLNQQMDFCYIIKETVQFYLYRHLDIENPIDFKCTVSGGDVLIFCFMRGEGVSRNCVYPSIIVINFSF